MHTELSLSNKTSLLLIKQVWLKILHTKIHDIICSMIKEIFNDCSKWYIIWVPWYRCFDYTISLDIQLIDAVFNPVSDDFHGTTWN